MYPMPAADSAKIEALGKQGVLDYGGVGERGRSFTTAAGRPS